MSGIMAVNRKGIGWAKRRESRHQKTLFMRFEVIYRTWATICIVHAGNEKEFGLNVKLVLLCQKYTAVVHGEMHSDCY
jgi:hypothetical protein